MMRSQFDTQLAFVVTVLFFYVMFKEKLSVKVFDGLYLMVAGTLAMAIWA